GSRISMGRPASESRRHVTCSPSSQRILTETALAQTIRPSTPSSVQRTRLPIFSAGELVLAVVGVFVLLFFFALIVDLLVLFWRGGPPPPGRGDPPAATPEGVSASVHRKGHDLSGVVAQVGEGDTRGGHPIRILLADHQVLACQQDGLALSA